MEAGWGSDYWRCCDWRLDDERVSARNSSWESIKIQQSLPPILYTKCSSGETTALLWTQNVFTRLNLSNSKSKAKGDKDLDGKNLET
jgi:hypothetical protein